MLIGLVKAGIGSVLQLPVSQKLAGSAVLRVAEIVRSHFLDSSHELAVAYRESWMRAMVAIASGLATEAELSGMWNKLNKPRRDPHHRVAQITGGRGNARKQAGEMGKIPEGGRDDERRTNQGMGRTSDQESIRRTGEIEPRSKHENEL